MDKNSTWPQQWQEKKLFKEHTSLATLCGAFSLYFPIICCESLIYVRDIRGYIPVFFL